MVPLAHSSMNRFELVRLSMLRAAQLIRGCTPRVPPGLKPTTTARREVLAGLVGSIDHGQPAIVADDAAGS